MHSLRTVTGAAAAAALAAALPLRAQQLDGTEQRIVQAVGANQQQAIALLEQIVNINSGTLNADGQRRVYDVLAPRFEALGFDVRYVQPAVADRGGHLVATRAGTRGWHLLLIGHLDTVFEEDSPFQSWTLVNDSIAKGPGASDMKGGDIVIWSALEALGAADALDGASITVVMTGDEERPGEPLEEARRTLVEAGVAADVALGFEGGTPGYGVIARRSSTDWRVDIEATTAHSSGVFSDGVGAGAIYEAGRVLEDFYSEIRGEEYLTFNAATIVGGTEATWDDATARGTAFGKTNVVPPTVVITGDIRTITDEQLERTRQKMREIVARPLPGTTSRITFGDGYPSMPPTDANRALLDTFSEVSEALGMGAVAPFDPGRRGAADISFVASLIEAGMDGLGPEGDGSHTVEETVNLNSIERAAQRAAVLMYRLTNEAGTSRGDQSAATQALHGGQGAAAQTSRGDQGAATQAMHGKHGSATHATHGMPAPAGPGYTAADVEFMQHMIGHHGQAVTMTDMVPTHGAGPALQQLAEKIDISQHDEIAAMQQWLRERGQVVPAPRDMHDMQMPGMLTDEEMARLDAARGAAFERLFLEFMIRHHEGALIMVDALFAAPGAGQDPDLFRFATDVDADQRDEIYVMQGMLNMLDTSGGN